MIKMSNWIRYVGYDHWSLKPLIGGNWLNFPKFTLEKTLQVWVSWEKIDPYWHWKTSKCEMDIAKIMWKLSCVHLTINSTTVSGPQLLTYLSRIPIIEWWVFRYGSKKGHHNGTCSKEIGRHVYTTWTCCFFNYVSNKNISKVVNLSKVNMIGTYVTCSWLNCWLILIILSNSKLAPNLCGIDHGFFSCVLGRT